MWWLFWWPKKRTNACSEWNDIFYIGIWKASTAKIESIFRAKRTGKAKKRKYFGKKTIFYWFDACFITKKIVMAGNGQPTIKNNTHKISNITFSRCLFEPKVIHIFMERRYDFIDLLAYGIWSVRKLSAFSVDDKPAVRITTMCYFCASFSRSGTCFE